MNYFKEKIEAASDYIDGSDRPYDEGAAYQREEMIKAVEIAAEPFDASQIYYDTLGSIERTLENHDDISHDIYIAEKNLLKRLASMGVIIIKE